MPTLPVNNNASDVYEYTLSRAYSSAEDSPRDQNSKIEAVVHKGHAALKHNESIRVQELPHQNQNHH